jgi:hypothetical protein
MKDWEDGGLGLKKVLNAINIKYEWGIICAYFATFPQMKHF